MRSPTSKFAVILVTLATLPGCNQPSPTTSASTPAETSTRPAEAVKKTALVGFALGSYIEPTTFAVGGQSLRFKTTDNLFAVVDFKNAVAGTPVTVILRDASGAEVVRKQRLIEDASQTTLNFDLGIPKERSLAPGTYKAEALIDNSSSSEAEITIA